MCDVDEKMNDHYDPFDVLNTVSKVILSFFTASSSMRRYDAQRASTNVLLMRIKPILSLFAAFAASPDNTMSNKLKIQVQYCGG